MNLQQLEYIVAVDTYRHFVTAADKCFVTQATLSMMIKKLEEELGAKIFDRSRHPVTPTDVGQKIIAQSKVTLMEARRIKELAQEESSGLAGELRLGIIPTLAPYILPLFLHHFLKKYPQVNLQIHELTTDEIVRRLKNHHLDAGLLATPLHDPGIYEKPLFYEEFVVYAAHEEKLSKKKYLLPEDIDVNRLWLLEEGHCLREQVINLCELKAREKQMHQLDFSSGSIETLKRLVDSHHGITILPKLALQYMSEAELKKVKHFKAPAPVREIGLITHRYVVKQRMLNALSEEIQKGLPSSMLAGEKHQIIPL